MVCGYVYRAGSDGLSGSQVNTKTSLVFLGWFLFLDLLFFLLSRLFLIGPEKDGFSFRYLRVLCLYRSSSTFRSRLFLFFPVYDTPIFLYADLMTATTTPHSATF